MSDELLIEVDPASPPGTIAAVDLLGSRFAVARHAEGWSMFADRCPHAGCSFADDGGEIADGTTLVCACHGSEFDLRTGEVLLGPATVGLEVTPLHEDGGGLTPADHS